MSNTTRTLTVKLDKPYEDTFVDVRYTHAFDSDYPELEEIEIEMIFTKGDIMTIFDHYTLETLEDELRSKISEYERGRIIF
jgi:hypothetical protein